LRRGGWFEQVAADERFLFLSLSALRKYAVEETMRHVINTIANVTTNGIVRNPVRTIVAGVDMVRASLHLLRLYAAPALGRWDAADGDLAKCQKPFAGKQKPAGTVPSCGGCDMTSRSCRESTRCRRPRESSCLARS
jgi:hypothetical protein